MKNYFTLLLLAIFQPAFSQLPQVQWSKCFGGTAGDRAYAVTAANKEGYIMCGYTNSTDGDVTFNHGGSDAWIVKTDTLGNIEWQKSYGGSNSDLLRSIIPTSDGGYVACGETASEDGDVTFNHGMTDAWVVKIDSVGNLLWQNTYGGSDFETANDIVPSDDGYFVVGQTFSDDGDVHNYKDSGDAWFLSIDSDGYLMDSKTKGGHQEDGYNNIIPTTYGGFLVSGYSFSNDASLEGLNHGGSDAWLVKLNKTGALQWTQCYGGIYNDGAYKATQNQDGDYILSGWYSPDSINQNSWFFSIDSGGVQLTDHNYGGDSSEYAGPVFQNYLTTYVVAPASSSEISGDLDCHIGAEDIWMYETETSGGINWQKCLGGTGNERSTSSLLASDSSYIICGYTNSVDGDVTGNHGDYDWWLVKLIPGCSVHASFTFASSGSNVDFTNTSVNDSTWHWDFGDGFTSTDENPTHTFPGLGFYNVCLIVTAGTGACLPDTFCTEVAICGQPAVAQFNYTISGSQVTFDNNSQHSTTWNWTFGDGTNSSAQNPVHNYTANGAYEVCLVAIYEGCSTDTLCQSFTICAFPITGSFTSDVNSAEVHFTDTTPSSISWSWDFGDGATSSDQNPIHTYTSDGVYEACLIVSDGCGADTVCQSITICIVPTASFGFSVNGLSVDFVDQSDNITGWLWEFGDGSTSNTPNPTYVYSTGGTFNVCLIASNTCGNDTICQDVFVQCPPFTGGFVFTQSNDTAFFTDQSGNSISWNWDFGDGITSTEENPVHIYAQNGTFSACLIVTDGCSSDTICQQVIVIGVSSTMISGSDITITTYPNPFSESTTVELSLNVKSHITIYMLDVNGRKIRNVTNKTFSAGTHQLLISAKGLSPGIYFLQVIDAASNSMHKLIIQ